MQLLALLDLNNCFYSTNRPYGQFLRSRILHPGENMRKLVFAVFHYSVLEVKPFEEGNGELFIFDRLFVDLTL